MRNLARIIIALFCLSGLATPAHAAKPSKAIKSSKERLVLMPLRLGEADQSRQAAMETALVEGLQYKYEVFSGEQVAKKAKQVFLKESRVTAKKECDETRCMQDIAEAFQAELIATANVSKQDDGYFLVLSIQNIFDNKVVYSKSTPCQSCNAYQVVDKLKELSGASAQLAQQELTPAVESIDVVPMRGKALDPESALWAEVQKGNSADDYGAYLGQYPKGKYVALAKSRLNKFKNEEVAETAQREQSAWNSANSAGTEAGYQAYLNSYPNGGYASLAQVRINKLKKGYSAVTAQDSKASKTFKDCSDCPEMVVIPAGSFEMGSLDGGSDENPVHSVTISHTFAMGKTEVTQRQWQAIMGENPAELKSCGDDCPVEQVSWDDAQAYIQKLNTKTGKQYRLPTEAEWEYACRAGVQQKYCGGDKEDSVAWYKKNSRNATHPVAIKQANAFGLYDMSGNVWEWVEDGYHSSYEHAKSLSSLIWSNEPGSFVSAPIDGSAWLGEDDTRVLRGGSWKYVPQFVRAASRMRYGAEGSSDEIGFRLARTLP